MKAKFLFLALSCLLTAVNGATVDGELRKWHKVTLGFTGPVTGEAATPNPFTDYRLDVTFTHAGSGKTYIVPGYFAADGNAANTSASTGNLWRAHFAPDETGTWTYRASFRSGANVATSASTTAGSSAGHFDGDQGSIAIAATDKAGRDLRGKGRLQYVGKHHLRFAETGGYFMKAGVDSPENLLSYRDFDGDFKSDGRDDDLVKDWQPHAGDWNSGDPVWQGGKGKGLIGAVNYLASEGLNSLSFLTMNINGDDNNVFPYTTFGERARLDVSRLDQWEIVFEHATRNGMYLHFKTQETENELLLDGGATGNQRKLYYRELIARFGHHLALNWNLGEETNDASTSQKVAWAQYFHDTDPYHHLIVIHNGDSHYDLLGSASKLTGFSRQMNAADFTDTFGDIKNYIDRSAAAGKPWVVAADEPGDSQYSLRPDSNAASSHADARKHALWATIMAGGAGCEFYFGYALEESDLNCEDFRSRDAFWDYCRHALAFIESSGVPFQDMKNQNPLVSGSGNNANRCLAKPGSSYLVHLPSGGSATLNLAGAGGSFQVKWFDPRNGGSLIPGNTVNGGGTVSLGAPPNPSNQDWVALLQQDSGEEPLNRAPVANAGPDTTATLVGSSAQLALNGSASDDGLPAGSTLSTVWTRVSGPAAVSFANASATATTATFTASGSYTLRLAASDGDLTTADEIVVTVGTQQPANQAPVVNAGPDTTATLAGSSAQLALDGSASDDGLPGGSTLSTVWTRVSGPAAVSFADASATATTAVFSTAGTYLLRLSASDGTLSSTDDLRVTVSAPPDGGTSLAYLPVHDAYTENGKNFNNSGLRLENTSRKRIIYLQFDLRGATSPINSARIRLTEGDDVSSGSMTLRLYAASSNNWTESTVNGTNAPSKGQLLDTVTDDITNGENLDFDVSALVSTAGIYSFILEADPSNRDVSLASSENSTVSARPVLVAGGSVAPPGNAPPVVNAGPDRSATRSGSTADVSLTGSATDDGLPAGGTLSVTWSRVSGPGAVSFSPATSPAATATFAADGTYVLRLSASDGELGAADDVSVTIASSPNSAPAVSAGPDRSATLSGSSAAVTLGGSATDDGQPAGSTLSLAWSRVSGPAAVVFSAPSSAVTGATFSMAGTYVLRLTASDGTLASSDDVTVSVLSEPVAGNETRFPAVQDAYTENGKNQNATVLRVENSSRKRIVYLQFDLRSLQGDPSSAILRLTEGDDVSSGAMTLRLHSASTDNWTESTVSGSNAPEKAGEIGSFTGDVTNGRVIAFDVSAAVTAPGIYSFILEADPSPLDVSFASSENSSLSARPSLEVNTATAAASAFAAIAGTPAGQPLTSEIRPELISSPDTGLRIVATGVPAALYQVQRSVDLIDWITLATVTAEADGTIGFSDPSPPAGKAFYRLSDP
jgi:Domain of unknown function (DUF5060)/Putative collagen-binding domain of a collagenase